MTLDGSGDACNDRYRPPDKSASDARWRADGRSSRSMRRSSDSWEGLYMLRRDIDENKVLYQCKAEGAAEYDSLVFLLEWRKIDSTTNLLP